MERRFGAAHPVPPSAASTHTPGAAPPLAAASPLAASSPLAATSPRAGTGIVREDAPRRIPLSPLRAAPALQPSPSLVPSAALSSPSAHSGNNSPFLHWANELPDDPVQASHVMHLYPASLAPPFSPGHAMHRTPSDVSQPRSPHTTGLGLQPGAALPQTPSRLIPPVLGTAPRASPEPSIFERNIEPANRARSPQEAIDASVPPVLDDAASAIVDDASTLEILQPEHAAHVASPPRSPGMRMRSAHLSPVGTGAWTPTRGSSRMRHWSGGPPGENAPASRSAAHQQQFGRQHGHRRPLSDASNVFTSLPAAREERSSALRPPTPRTPHTRSYSVQTATSPSLSVDGAIIPGNDAATMGHSLDGLADAFVQLATTPSEPRMVTTPGSVSSPHGSYFALSPDEGARGALGAGAAGVTSPGAIRYRVLERDAAPAPAPAPAPTSPAAREHLQVPGSERKRLSFMAYSDIVNERPEQLVDLDESVHLQMQEE